MDKPTVENLRACVDDVGTASRRPVFGPDDPEDYQSLIRRLARGRAGMPPLYRTGFVDPLRNELLRLGARGFDEVRQRGDEAILMFDLAHAVLQNSEGVLKTATDAFQEVVSDLYDGFLSAEDRRGVEPPTSIVPPLVKWGRPNDGPYTWPIDAARAFGVSTGIVSLPPAFSEAGLLAWAALGHETAGHDVLRADRGLHAELADAVRNALGLSQLQHLADYWGERIDETASDIMGILNMGPAAGIGLVGFLRGWTAPPDGDPKLRSVGEEDDPHPADVVRGYLAAAAVGGLAFGHAKDWAALIDAETDRDAAPLLLLAGRGIDREDAKRSAQVVAAAIMNTPMLTLEQHALAQIQNWRDEDEVIVAELRKVLAGTAAVSSRVRHGMYAAHAVAAAITTALQPGAEVELVLPNLIKVLKAMHDRNASWGPLFVRNPGDLVRHTHARAVPLVANERRRVPRTRSSRRPGARPLPPPPA